MGRTWPDDDNARYSRMSCDSEQVRNPVLPLTTASSRTLHVTLKDSLRKSIILGHVANQTSLRCLIAARKGSWHPTTVATIPCTKSLILLSVQNQEQCPRALVFRCRDSLLPIGKQSSRFATVKQDRYHETCTDCTL